MAWSGGYEHIRVDNWPRGLIPVGTKIYANIFYPSNVFYRKMKCHCTGYSGGRGAFMCAPNHEMSALIQDMAIGDVWLEITYRGPSVAPVIETLD
jgi:hypothetical protein